MKQCPACQSYYADDSLSFCLNDGAALLAMPDEQVTRERLLADGIAGDQMRVKAETPPLTGQHIYPSVVGSSARPSKSGKTVFIVTGIALLFLLLIGGIVAALILVPRESRKTDTPLKTPTPETRDNSNELKEKIVNLERQIQSQKKTSPSPHSTAAAPPPTPAPLDSSGKATARVAPSKDGFLSLRTEPSVRTGAQLVKIPNGSLVELEDCQTNYQTVDGRRGRWCMISYAGRTGWAFDGWLIY